MKKVGGILLIVLSVILLVLAVLKLISMASLLLSDDLSISSYLIGNLVGALLGTILFSALAYKAFKKGRALTKSDG